jgi:hypothetical protein
MHARGVLLRGYCSLAMWFPLGASSMREQRLFSARVRESSLAALRPFSLWRSGSLAACLNDALRGLVGAWRGILAALRCIFSPLPGCVAMPFLYRQQLG